MRARNLARGAFACGLLLAAAAQAQHRHTPVTTAEDPHAAHRRATAQVDDPAERAAVDADAADHGDHDAMDHGAMDHGAMDHEAMDHVAMDHDAVGHAGMDHGAADHGAMGHGAAGSGTIDHAGMDHAAMGHGNAPPHAPRTPIPPLTDADRAAAFAPLDGHATHDERIVHMLRVDRLEASDADGLAWEASAWVGNDWNRLWLRSEGEREHGATHAADLELLYGRPVARWWDLLAGVRHDFQPGPSRTWAAVGIVGLAPQWFEVQATAYLGESGALAAEAEVEYELLLTNRLVLQPLLELAWHGEDDPRRGIGSGLSSAELGLRLRYEIDRQFAPYVGIVRERVFGDTAELRRAAGEDTGETRVVAGVRFWF